MAATVVATYQVSPPEQFNFNHPEKLAQVGVAFREISYSLWTCGEGRGGAGQYIDLYVRFGYLRPIARNMTQLNPSSTRTSLKREM